MRNYIKKTLCVCLVILFLYNSIVFFIPYIRRNNATFWITFVFSNLAIISQIFFFLISFNKKENIKSIIYGFPIIKLGIIYISIQLVISIIILAINSFVYMSYWIALLIHIIILCLVIIRLIVVCSYRDEIEKQEYKSVNDNNFIQDLLSDLNVLINDNKDKEICPYIRKLFEEIKYSDPTNNSELIDIDNKIRDEFLLLKENLNIEVVNRLIYLIQHRNAINKKSKNKCI